MTILASDAFTGTDGAGLGANWTTITGVDAPVISSNQAKGPAGTAQAGARFSGGLVGGGAWPANQYSEIVVGLTVSTTTDEGVGGACRIASGAKTFYFVQTNTHETRLYKCVAGSFTPLGSDAAACVSGDLLRLICIGNQISVTKNGATIIAAVPDSDIASGAAGIWDTELGQGTINAFEGGDLPAQIAQRGGINLSTISAIDGITKSGISAINGLTI